MLAFMRHGETDWNALDRYQGHTDIELNAEGERQARRAAVRTRNRRGDRTRRGRGRDGRPRDRGGQNRRTPEGRAGGATPVPLA